jgi:hypothetical protein
MQRAGDGRDPAECGRSLGGAVCRCCLPAFGCSSPYAPRLGPSGKEKPGSTSSAGRPLFALSKTHFGPPKLTLKSRGKYYSRDIISRAPPSRPAPPGAAVGWGVGWGPRGSLPGPSHLGPICEKSRYQDAKPTLLPSSRPYKPPGEPGAQE